ncbi:unnamed protein product, partial [Allacma fusca]
ISQDALKKFRIRQWYPFYLTRRRNQFQM